MKAKYALLIVVGLQVCFFACKKDANKINHASNGISTGGSNQTSTVVTPASLVGNWSIVTDSTFAGAGLMNHPVDYTGQVGDYFNINANGHIYTKEGVVSDTLSYTMLSDTTIVISPFVFPQSSSPEPSDIITFTAHSLVIKAPELATPGGIFGRKISLSR